MPTGFVIDHASQGPISARRMESLAIRQPGRALENLGGREYTHRPLKDSINSLGNPPAAPPAHARGRPSSIAVRGSRLPWRPSYIARITQRCSCQALQALRLNAWTV